jgi:uncharacterized protein (TIGR03000 family)
MPPLPGGGLEPSPGPSPAPTPALPKTSGLSAENSGSITVWVPYDAKVTVNGMETRSTGSRRQYVSFGLQPGLSYKYVIRARVIQDGKPVEETQTITVTAGQAQSIAFGFNANPSEQVAEVH